MNIITDIRLAIKTDRLVAGSRLKFVLAYLFSGVSLAILLVALARLSFFTFDISAFNNKIGASGVGLLLLSLVLVLCAALIWASWAYRYIQRRLSK